MPRQLKIADAQTVGQTRRVTSESTAHSCYFRSAATDSGRKALIQITERCNLHCAHCFVSSTRKGRDIDAAVLRDVVLPRLRRARVERITLTGGEPFVHQELLQICTDAVSLGLSVGICTNGTGVSDAAIQTLRNLGRIHVNISFDGFRAETHGRFRGSPESFELTVDAARRLGEAGLLQGFLSTPNAFSSPQEYADLARFARDVRAEYLLMNPLSAFGRGVQSHDRLSADRSLMQAIRATVEATARGVLEAVPIRFPNAEKPLGSCIAGDIIYVFANGDVAVCPYLVFAARTPQSRYADTEFLSGNIFSEEIAERLDDYRFHERYKVGSNATCSSCKMATDCGKGCPAVIIAAGGSIGDRDRDLCPHP